MFRPHDGPQTEFCARGEFEVLYGGAAGPGKTECLIVLATRYVANPNYKGLILRRTFPQLQEIIDRCWKHYPSLGAYYRATDHRWVFPSGAVINLGHCQHEDDKYNYQGKEFQFIGFDELTQFSETQYLYLFSRSRSTDPSLPAQVRATTNPGGIGHQWVKERFVDRCKPLGTFIDPSSGLSRCFVPGTIYDNPTLVENDPGYLKRLEALPELEKKRLLFGDWEVFEGQAFPELSRSVHSCEPFDIPPEWERWMVMDWGYAKPFSVGWYAIDYDGVMYRYREWYGCKEGEADVGLKMTAEEVAKGILERERGDNVKFRVADPSIFSKGSPNRRRETVGPTVAEDMSGQGVFFLKADNDRIQGIQQMHKRFSFAENVNEHGEIEDSANFYAFSDQRHFWRTMLAMQVSAKNPEDIDTDQEDHIADEVRYSCMTRPVQPKRHSQIPVGSFTHERNKLIKARKYAQRHGVSLHVAYQRVR